MVAMAEEEPMALEQAEQRHVLVEGFPHAVKAAVTLAARMRSIGESCAVCSGSSSGTKSPKLHLQQDANAVSKGWLTRISPQCHSPQTSSLASALCPLVDQGGPSHKRKSPCSNSIMFQSPLSRMMLSPRPGILYAHSPISRAVQHCKRSNKSTYLRTRSPFVEFDLNASPSTSGESFSIDLNVEPEASAEIGEQSIQEEVSAATTQVNAQRRKRRKEVPLHIRNSIFEALLARSKNGELEGHETGEVAAKFSLNIHTVQRFWHDGKGCLDRGEAVDLSSKKSNRGRRRRKLTFQSFMHSRFRVKDVSKELGVSISKVHSMKREGTIERVSNFLKPLLTPENKKERLSGVYSCWIQGVYPMILSSKTSLILSSLMKSGLILLGRH